jgi:deoxyribonuclease-1-like protein
MEAFDVKWFKYMPLAMPLLIAITGYLGCENAQQALEQIPIGSLASNRNPSSNSQNQFGGNWNNNGATNVPQQYGNIPQNQPIQAQPIQQPGTNGRILIGSYNIQAFGPSKMDKPWIMERLAAIIRKFDVLAIQEIRSSDQNILNVLLSYVNQDGSRFNYLLGPRLGRSNSKEQYAYIFNTATIAAIENGNYTVRDDEDFLHREPLVARFVARGNGQYQPFSFTLSNVHTDPDEVKQEVSVLGRVYSSIAQFEAQAAGEDDVIMVGDFNADANLLASVATQREYVPTIVSAPTNVAGTKQYDNVLLNPVFCGEFTGNCGVVDLQAFLGMTQDEVRQLSDHLPVWCEFNIYESSRQTTTASLSGARY